MWLYVEQLSNSLEEPEISKILMLGSHLPQQADLASSAKSGQNCSDGANGGTPSRLKQLIADHIPWDKLPWTATPRLQAEMKQALLKMRDSADIRLLRFSELAQRREQALPGEKFGQPVDVYLVVRQTDERTGEEAIRWMNVTRYLKDRKDKKSRQIIFQGEALNMQAVWKLRDAFFQF